METKSRLFIYGRKEMFVLILLTIVVAAFAFTLGVHLGKKVSTKVVLQEEPAVEVAETVGDKVPGKQEISAQAKNVTDAADEELSQSLHNEVSKTGIRLEKKREMDLPTEVKSESKPVQAHAAGAHPAKTPALEKAPAKEEDLAPKAEAPQAARHSRPAHQVTVGSRAFSIQLASYPKESEAKAFSEEVAEKHGLDVFVKDAEVKGKGTWFRVYQGHFETRQEAEKAANLLKREGKIGSFVISKVN